MSDDNVTLTNEIISVLDNPPEPNSEFKNAAKDYLRKSSGTKVGEHLDKEIYEAFDADMSKYYRDKFNNRNNH